MTFSKATRVTTDHITPARDRPPGSLADTLLADACTGCGDCMDVCPLGLVLLDDDGFPLLMSDALCSRCGLCAEVCTPGAIRFTAATRAGLARIIAAQGGAGHR